MSKNISYLSGRKGLSENLFEELGETRSMDLEEAKKTAAKLSDEFLIGKANTYGSISFYDFLAPKNKGKEVHVCNGSACMCAGNQDELTTTLEQHIDKAKIGHMTCLGRCHENGAFQYKGKNY